MTPDLISIFRYEENTQFIIFDAKYYNIQLEKGKELRNQPGISDIIKQYIYQLAYKRFIDNQKIEKVKNCFLMPTQGDDIVNKGFVKMDMLSDLGLQYIQIRLLPARMLYDKYLARKKIDISTLEL